MTENIDTAVSERAVAEMRRLCFFIRDTAYMHCEAENQRFIYKFL